MPRMNGLELLAELKRQKIQANIIVVSNVTKSDAKETIQALELGAFDFVTKPDSYLEVKSNTFSDRILECLAVATRADESSTSNELPEKAVPDQTSKLPSHKII